MTTVDYPPPAPTPSPIALMLIWKALFVKKYAEKGVQGQDRTVDLPIFRRKRNSQLSLFSHTQFVGVSVWSLMGLFGVVESVHIKL